MGTSGSKMKRLSQPRRHQRELPGEVEDGAPEVRTPELASAAQKNAEVEVKKNHPPRHPPEVEPKEPSIIENLLGQPGQHQWELPGEGKDGTPATIPLLPEVQTTELADAVQKNVEVEVKKNQPQRHPPEVEPKEPSVRENLLSQPRRHQSEFPGEGEDGAPATNPTLRGVRPLELAGAVQKNAEIEVKNQPQRHPPEVEPKEPRIRENPLSQPHRRQQGLTTCEGVLEDELPAKVLPLKEDRPPELDGADHEDAEVEVKERQPPPLPSEQELTVEAKFCVDDNISLSTTLWGCRPWLVYQYHWLIASFLHFLSHVTWLSHFSNQVGGLSADCIINADERTDEIVDVIEGRAPSSEQSVEDGIEEFQDAVEEIQGVEFEEVEEIQGVEFQDAVEEFEEVEDQTAADENICLNLNGFSLSGLTSEAYRRIVSKVCPPLDE